MKVICANKACKYAKSLKVFDVESITTGKCPQCRRSDLLPAWAKKYKEMTSEKIDANINRSKEKLDNISTKLATNKSDKKSKTSKTKSGSQSASNTSKSLEDIELSYSKKFKKISESLNGKDERARFDAIDEHLMRGSANLNEINLELAELKNLFDEFESKRSNLSDSKTKSKDNKKDQSKDNVGSLKKSSKTSKDTSKKKKTTLMKNTHSKKEGKDKKDKKNNKDSSKSRSSYTLDDESENFFMG